MEYLMDGQFKMYKILTVNTLEKYKFIYYEKIFNKI